MSLLMKNSDFLRNFCLKYVLFVTFVSTLNKLIQLLFVEFQEFFFADTEKRK